ncbi:MAG: hypothetical protein ACK4HV_08585, partial [Parachlamydiaceae bacterium]
RDITQDVFNDYYKPSPELSSYYERHQNCEKVYVYRQPSYWSYFSHTTIVNNHYGAAPSRSRSKENDSAVVFAIIGTVIAVVGGYFLGKEVKKHTLANEGLKAVIELEKEVKQHHTDNQTKELLENGKRFFKTMERDSYTWVVIKASIVAGGVLMAIGGFAAMPALLAAGGITTAIGFTAAAIRYGLSFGDDAKMSLLAQKILRVN